MTRIELADSPQITWFVPGRIEVLGKHTDYAGGRSLLAAVDVGITVTATARSDEQYRLSTDLTGEICEFQLGHYPKFPAGHWANYPITVIKRLNANFPGLLSGAELKIHSDLPPASGMSSSSALISAIALSLADLFHLTETETWQTVLSNKEQVAEYLGCIENGQSYAKLAGDKGVGTFGGSQDHTAMLCAKADHLVQYAFAPTTFEDSLPLPADKWAFVVMVSGVLAEKTGAQLEDYNRVSRAVSDLVDRWNNLTGHNDSTLAAALASADNANQRLFQIAKPGYQRGRLSQYLAEAEEIIPAAIQALRNQDFIEFGQLVDRSQHLAETGLQNQIPQTTALAKMARSLGATAASAFGAGFGGSVYALIPRDQAEKFAANWLAAYADSFPSEASQAQSLITGAAGPARRIK